MSLCAFLFLILFIHFSWFTIANTVNVMIEYNPTEFLCLLKKANKNMYNKNRYWIIRPRMRLRYNRIWIFYNEIKTYKKSVTFFFLKPVAGPVVFILKKCFTSIFKDFNWLNILNCLLLDIILFIFTILLCFRKQ